MRIWILYVCGLILLASMPVAAHEDHEERPAAPIHAPGHQKDRPVARRHRRDHDERPGRSGRAWIGAGTGVGYGSVELPCSGGLFNDCSEEGRLRTYSANVTFSGRNAALRLRGIRDLDKGSDRRTPYETAALVGTRFGRSDWYGLVGAGRIRHADDRFKGDANGFAWEILLAPSSSGPVGFEMSFQGNSGRDVEFVAFNLGLRFGALR